MSFVATKKLPRLRRQTEQHCIILVLHIDNTGALYQIKKIILLRGTDVIYIRQLSPKPLKVKGRHLYTATYMNMTSSGLQCEVAY